MRKKISKTIIVNLIRDDLKYQHTVQGLRLLGFDNENASLNICISVFSLMELNIHDKRLEYLTDEYCNRSARVEEFAHNDSESFEWLALDIYNWLMKETKKYRKKL